MKIVKYQYLTYDSNRMYIGTFEDEEYAQKWASKHGGYVDRHCIERDENRIYDDLLKDMVRKEIADRFAEMAERESVYFNMGNGLIYKVVHIEDINAIRDKITEGNV